MTGDRPITGDRPERTARLVPFLALAALVTLTAARFECSLGRSVTGTEGVLSIRSVAITPSEVTLPTGAVAVLEGIAVDELGGRVEAPLTWAATDPAVASVAPRRATRTVVTARSGGETIVTATHRGGAADTVRVRVTGDEGPR